MAKILLDYFMPITIVEPIPAASTAFLKQVCVVAKPATGSEGDVGETFVCTSMAQVAAHTDNEDAQHLFDAGMSKVSVLLANDLDLAEALALVDGDFFTVLISSDFDDEDVDVVQASLVKAELTFTAVRAGSSGDDISIELLNTADAGEEVVTVTADKVSVTMESGTSTAQQIKDAIEASEEASDLITVEISAGDEAAVQTAFAEDNLENGAGLAVGSFDGVTGYASDDAEFAAEFAATESQCGFWKDEANGAATMFYAFGKLLSNLANWTNQQYITTPVNDNVETLGDANTLFDTKVSFALHDEEFGNRLALFAVGGKAIVSPYIKKNLSIDLQSRALTWISANQPQYTLTNAALLEQRLQEDVINQQYIQTQWIERGIVSITLVNDNFVGTAEINISEPSALWRIFGEMSSTL